MNCEIDGVKYVSAPDNGHGCDGCAAKPGSVLCRKLPLCDRIVWLKATHSELTDDEILVICDNFSNEFGVEQKELIPCIRAAIEADRAKR